MRKKCYMVLVVCNNSRQPFRKYLTLVSCFYSVSSVNSVANCFYLGLLHDAPIHPAKEKLLFMVET